MCVYISTEFFFSEMSENSSKHVSINFIDVPCLVRSIYVMCSYFKSSELQSN